MSTVSIAILLISTAVLALELTLVRAISIGHLHHLSFLIISTALLGFGAGGTVIAIGSARVLGRADIWLWRCAVGFALAIVICFRLSQLVGLDELLLIWDRRQILYLFAYYLLFFVPFFFAGTFVALAFSVRAQRAGTLYFFNMTGSGLGAAAAVAFMYGNDPATIMLIISGLAFLAALVMTKKLSRRHFVITAVCALACICAFLKLEPLKLSINISEHKSLIYYTALPGAKTVTTRYSPLARADLVRAPVIRIFPGLSIRYQGKLPEQEVIITDADGACAVNRFSSLDELACYKHTTSAVAYELVNEPNVCIIGSGGGSDIAQAIVCKAKSVTAVEVNQQIIDILCNQNHSSSLYDRKDVEVIVAEGRSFLQTTKQQFDVISISMLDSFSASAAGLYTLNESHLYTIEAIRQGLDRLSPGGILNITRMLKTPPRDCIKMFATIVEAMRQRGINNPAEHIIMIRSWSTATILACPKAFTKSQIETACAFTNNNGFDLVHLPNIRADQVNRNHRLDEPIYYKSAQQILENPQKFYRNYLYNVKPATDDRPYFFDFFKLQALGSMIKTIGRQWLVFSEWGYLILIITLAQATAAGAVFILLPLFIAKPVKGVKTKKLITLAYFSLLGVGFMFIEMAFIQKLTLLIGHPIFGVSVTLVGFLTFSGLGSLLSGYLVRSPALRISTAVFAIAVFGLAEIALLKFGFEQLVAFSRAGRIAISILTIAPLAFFMGMPFPTGLAAINKHSRSLVPWAWGINGFASVTGAVLGTVLAISIGFTALVFTSLGCYVLAALLAKPICRPATADISR